MTELAKQPKRYLNINSAIRKYVVEAGRDLHFFGDESQEHTAERVQEFSDTIRGGIPDARITWALSWGALTDTSERYRRIREKVKEMHRVYNDEVTFLVGGFFPIMYNTSDEINKDIHDALKLIEEMMDGYRPKSLICGYLSAPCIEYAREHEGIIAVQGTIWSQYGVDLGDGDGGMPYPFYPSKQHYLKPAQGKADFIDCFNLDCYTVDSICARNETDRGVDYNSRTGVGGIETYNILGLGTGMQQAMHSTRVHFDENIKHNPYGWVVNTVELSQFGRGKPFYREWPKWIKETWDDVQCLTQTELAEALRKEFPDNSALSYCFKQSGSGIVGPIKGGSVRSEEVAWIMNQSFRLGILKKEGNQHFVYDYTDYRQEYREPTFIPNPVNPLTNRGWSLMGEINQKRSRTQDKPVPFEDFTHWEDVYSTLTQRERTFLDEFVAKPMEITINDSDCGDGIHQVAYDGNWMEVRSGVIFEDDERIHERHHFFTYNYDMHTSAKPGATYTLRFVGSQIKLFTTLSDDFGIFGLSIDGGEEVLVDLYSPVLAEQALVYTSPVLTGGEHTLKVRVTGERNPKSDGFTVAADRFDVIQ